MRLNKKALKTERAKRENMDEFLRRTSKRIGNYSYQRLGFRWVQLAEGNRGYLVPTGKEALLLTTLLFGESEASDA